jgi:hypothetical protein
MAMSNKITFMTVARGGGELPSRRDLRTAHDEAHVSRQDGAGHTGQGQVIQL